MKVHYITGSELFFFFKFRIILALLESERQNLLQKLREGSERKEQSINYKTEYNVISKNMSPKCLLQDGDTKIKLVQNLNNGELF